MYLIGNYDNRMNFRSGDRRSAVEILKASRQPLKTTQRTTKGNKNELQDKLRRLLNGESSEETVTEWEDCLENLLYDGSMDVRYQSLPDLSASSHESLSSSTCSSISSKSYGKPPSLPLSSPGGSDSKLNSSTKLDKVQVQRSKSMYELKTEDDELSTFFQLLGLTEDGYREMTRNSSTSSPIFFSSVSSEGSIYRRYKRYSSSSSESSSPLPPTETVSVVQTNARVVKWLCRLSANL